MTEKAILRQEEGGMQGIRQIALCVRNPQDLLEGTRSALGLAVENMQVTLFILHDPGAFSEAVKENLEWLQEMECRALCSDPAGARLYGLPCLPEKEIARQLVTMDLVIPFGSYGKTAPSAEDDDIKGEKIKTFPETEPLENSTHQKQRGNEVLHVLKTPPDHDLESLLGSISQEKGGKFFTLYDEAPDLNRLIELVFETPKTICWW